MRFHDCSTAPSPRRVRIFMAEKGISLPTVQVDLKSGEHLEPAFRRLNPWCTVPVLELDDGTCISEAMAVCRFLEEIHPDPPLMGRDAREKGLVAMWEHRCEIDGFLAAAEALRNATPRMKGRALPGPEPYEQIPALAERGRKRVQGFFKALDQRLADSAFLAGDTYTVADITAQVAVDFAGWIKLTIPEALVHARRWHDSVSARPSAGA
ncbi:MAG: glutathione S-transferase [Rhodospirillales bacterium]|nr:MAG: glutathione S-transferase [Rhodospirillales bacterium]